MKCDPQISPNCPGDHEPSKDKWPDCLTPALWFYPDESVGDVDSPCGFTVLIIQEKAETLSSDELPVTIPAGTYMTIRENDQGHIAVEAFESAQAAQDAYDKACQAYEAWSWAQECRELDIIESTGRRY